MNDQHAHIMQTPDTSLLTTEQMQSRIHELEQENAALKASAPLFQRVMTASAVYVERFGGEIKLEGAMQKMHEEWKEFNREIVDYQTALKINERPSIALKTRAEMRREDAVKEAIDLMVTVGGVLHALGVKIETTEAAAHSTLGKLDSRTTDDYAWNGTTVERIGKTQS